MAKQNTTTTANFDITAREIDFVTRFTANWEALRDILGVSRLIRKAPGTQLKAKYAEVTLANSVAEGEEIPYSATTVKEKPITPITVEKYAKAVTLEAISEYGYDDAVGLTDDQFLFELANKVKAGFYNFLKTGSLISAKNTFQSALAEAQGRVRNKWKLMGKGITDVVGFCNILDAYDYLGAAGISVQSEFGMNYIENFIGYKKLFLCADSEVKRGVIIATPVENLVNYYVSPDDADFKKAGLDYTTDGITNLIGFHAQGNYGTAVSESFAFMGMALLAEYIDGIAVVDIGTATFTAVSTSSDGYSSKNPATEGWFEKGANNDYFPTTDTTVDSDKTYYTRAVTPAA